MNIFSVGATIEKVHLYMYIVTFDDVQQHIYTVTFWECAHQDGGDDNGLNPMILNLV